MTLRQSKEIRIYNSIHSGSVEEKSLAIITIVYVVIIKTISRLNPVYAGYGEKLPYRCDTSEYLMFDVTFFLPPLGCKTHRED